tara:strand:- start:499 stop:726 length:228 start_codon:yes stop_codon:yes gene_type:complete
VTAFKGVITGPAEKPEALFIGLKSFAIACTFCCDFGGNNNDDLGGRRCWSYVTGDADRKRKNLNFFSESIFLWYE